MTREELEARLEDALQDRLYYGDEYPHGGFHFGTSIGEGSRPLSLMLVRKGQEGPCSVYTPTLIPQDWDEEWQIGAQIWEVQWRTIYEVVRVEVVHRPLHLGEDPRDYPGRDDYHRWEVSVLDTLDAVEQMLGTEGRSLADLVPLAEPWQGTLPTAEPLTEGRA